MHPFLMTTQARALGPGDRAPEFTARNQDGKAVRLSDYKGHPVLIYFYPKDDTPGCTREACELRDQYSKYQSMGAVILGVSRQNEESHKMFKAKYQLPFDLLSDEDGKVAAAYQIGVVPLLGVYKRQSVLVGPDGRVIRNYEDVSPARHAHEVLEDLSNSQA